MQEGGTLHMAVNKLMNQGINVQFGNSRNTEKVKQQEKDGQQKKNTVFAGDLNMNQDLIKDKRELAQKKAFKLISNQQKADYEIDEDLRNRRLRQVKLAEEGIAAQKEISNINELKEDMMKTYGLTEDSQEHKDIELWKKHAAGGFGLTEDERQRLEDLGEPTEYQKAMMEFDEMIEVFKDLYDATVKESTMENRAIDSIKLELLKIHPMVDEQKNAAKILEEARKTEINMLINESKDHIDETMEEEAEKAEEIAEASKETSAEKVSPEEANIEDIQEATEEVSDLDRELRKIMKDNNMLDEDLKGIKVNQTV